MVKSKFFFVALLFFVAFEMSHSAKAQQNVVKINILSPIIKTLNMSYEHAVSDESSFQLGFFYTGAKSGDVKLSGFGITPEYRYFLSQTPAPNGVYIAPFLRYQSFDATNSSADAKGTVSSFGGGLVIGREWIFKKKISLETFLGPQYMAANAKTQEGNSNDIEVSAGNGFWIRFGVNFGFAF